MSNTIDVNFDGHPVDIHEAQNLIHTHLEVFEDMVLKPVEEEIDEPCYYFDCSNAVQVFHNPWSLTITIGACLLDYGVRAFPDEKGVYVVSDRPINFATICMDVADYIMYSLFEIEEEEVETC